MRSAKIFVNSQLAGYFIEREKLRRYEVYYLDHYQGQPISLTLPIETKHFNFDHFPSFLEGLLPEGPRLEALLKQAKLDRNDFFGQIMEVGQDLVGAISLQEDNKPHD